MLCITPNPGTGNDISWSCNTEPNNNRIYRETIFLCFHQESFGDYANFYLLIFYPSVISSSNQHPIQCLPSIEYGL